MSNAWYYYLGPLGVATAFVFAGVLSLCLYLFGGRGPDGKKRTGLGNAIFGTVFCLGLGGTFGGYFLLTSLTPWQRQELQERIFLTPPEQIDRFIIKAGRPGRCCHISDMDVVIDDPARIRQFAEFLRTAAGLEVSSRRREIRWIAEVTMVTTNGDLYFSVCATEPGDRSGTTVAPWPTEEGGWNMGQVRADGLETLLDDAVAKARKLD